LDWNREVGRSGDFRVFRCEPAQAALENDDVALENDGVEVHEDPGSDRHR
jgi:hypothetical protein